MPELKSIKELFDEQSEIMAWITWATGMGLLIGGFISDTIFLGMVTTALVTMLGSEHFKGLRVEGGGVE